MLSPALLSPATAASSHKHFPGKGWCTATTAHTTEALPAMGTACPLHTAPLPAYSNHTNTCDRDVSSAAACSNDTGPGPAAMLHARAGLLNRCQRPLALMTKAQCPHSDTGRCCDPLETKIRPSPADQVPVSRPSKKNKTAEPCGIHTCRCPAHRNQAEAHQEEYGAWHTSQKPSVAQQCSRLRHGPLQVPPPMQNANRSTPNMQYYRVALTIPAR
jgi:hypothetical protein